ncbi:hypothetical protein LAZ67_23000349 [Cordylochernes scorpioides]|uniref:Reverse transcriptase domain-containing protein n=1 Tax=Cordylochernes scorpioides TaxID=51811 RepID=A0ABY6LSD1_9ARAC|nr:hypothetical protein LAZ67_23000349 [Cordylochernes scorpioides]
MNNSSIIIIEEEEIMNIISNSDVKKAPGLDNISNNMIKCAYPKIKLMLFKLFNKCIQKGQHGFVKSKSACLNKITDAIIEHRQKELVTLIAIEIEGAFDNTWWPALIKRIDEDNMPADLLKILQSLLKNRKIIFNYSSRKFSKTLSKGCPQVFYIFHNKDKFEINSKNNIITPVQEIKILGITFANQRRKNKLNFNPHLNNILNRTQRLKILLFSICGKSWGLSTKTHFIQTIFRPILTYGTEVWYEYISKKYIHKFNSLQYQILLWCTQTYKTTSYSCVHTLANIPLITDYMESRNIKYDLNNLSIENQERYDLDIPDIIENFIKYKMTLLKKNTNQTFQKLVKYPLLINQDLKASCKTSRITLTNKQSRTNSSIVRRGVDLFKNPDFN